MARNLRIIGALLVLAFICSLSLASAQTLIAGKIYNSDFSQTIDRAYTAVTCNSHSLSTNSLGDGTYAVRFEESECDENDSVSVTASKSGFSEKTASEVIKKCENGDCGGNYFAIINLGLAVSSSGNTGGNTGGHGGGRYYSCGNGICDTGETINTCPQDCRMIEPLMQTATTTEENSEELQTLQTPTENEGFSAGITGAVIGVLGSAEGIVVIFFILGILAMAITVNFVRKRKTSD